MPFIPHGSLNMMTSPAFAFCAMCLFLGEMAQATDQRLPSSHHDKSTLLSANVGESLTLQCLYAHNDSTRMYWYKQSLGQKPRVMCTFYLYNKNGMFHDEFKSNRRFTLYAENSKIHLKITNLTTSDSALYYCARRISYITEFAEGITVSVKGSVLNIPVLVHQSTSETIQPGGSVSLNCTVHTGTCDGEHSVYWFKNSEESHPGLIYTQGGRNDQCEKKPNTQTHTCVYNLAMKTLNVSHAETYYCAVALCGNIVFGNGTKLNFEDEVNSSYLMYFLSGALTVTIFLNVLLASLMCVTYKGSNCKNTESRTRFSAPSTTNAEGDQNEESIHYTALREHNVNRSGLQRNNSKPECVYSIIKH